MKEKLYEAFKNEFINMLDEMPNIDECKLHTIEDETDELYYDDEGDPIVKTIKYSIGHSLKYKIEDDYYAINYYYDGNIFMAHIKNEIINNWWYFENN